MTGDVMVDIRNQLRRLKADYRDVSDARAICVEALPDGWVALFSTLDRTEEDAHAILQTLQGLPDGAGPEEVFAEVKACIDAAVEESYERRCREWGPN